ncbi:hypothetical protein B9W68_14870 [Streptomyces sp. CS227]|uniref:hypothetical protein n=1 Tax=Streptomyces sp. CS227 TaxID=1982763 RepID=UPI000B419977|nr:hypothetical protein [Streptomyces sp. CS227]OWA11115.1 hypothetical protein B9W68_14870 [Streptomyces sp. CS227]
MHSYGTGEAPTRLPSTAPDLVPETAAGEQALLDGGPAHGTRLRVLDRPAVVQVTYPCRTEDGPTPFRVDALYVYRRDPRVHHEPLRYGYDHASP